MVGSSLWSCLNGMPGATTRCRCHISGGGTQYHRPGSGWPGTRRWPTSAPGPGGTRSSCWRRCPGAVLAIDGSQQCFRNCVSGSPGSWTGSRCCRPICASRCRPAPVDAVLSVATLHWLPDHAQVFSRWPGYSGGGGQFVAEAGGAGNIASVGRPWPSWRPTTGKASGTSPEWRDPRPPGRRRFTSIEVGLVLDPARLESADQFEAYLATVILGVHLRDMPPAERAPVRPGGGGAGARAGGRLRPAADPRGPRPPDRLTGPRGREQVFR